MITFLKIIIITIFFKMTLFAHCQIPCGIYSDAMRIVQIKEDLQTIEKSIMMIKKLSGESNPQAFNQINRWIASKEEHANNIQDIVIALGDNIFHGNNIS